MKRIVEITSDLSDRFKTLSLISAVLVVLIHIPFSSLSGSCSWLVKVLPLGLCRVAVPFFFFAAGFFIASHMYGNAWWRKEVVKRFRTLLVPYVIWGEIYAVLLAGVALMANDLLVTGLTTGDNLKYILNPINVFGLDMINQPVLKLLWFVRALFVMVLISPFLKLVADIKWGLGMAVLTGIYFILPMFWDRLGIAGGVFGFGALSLTGIFFFTLGLFTRRSISFFIVTRKIAIPLSIIGIGALILSGYVPKSDFVIKIGCIALILGVLNICPYCSWISKISWISFPIYITHRLVLLPIRGLFYCVAGVSSPTNVWEYIFMCVACLFVTAFCCNLFNVFAPRIAGVAFGGRVGFNKESKKNLYV